MKLKKIIPLIVITFFALAPSGLNSVAVAKEIVIKFSHVVSVDTPKGKGAELFKKLVAERLKGKVRIEVFPNSQLYNDKDVFKALLRNDVQIAVPSLSKFGRFTKKYGVFDLPFLFKGEKSVQCFTTGKKGRELLSAVNHKGYLGLGYWISGIKQLSANNALIKPDDAKNKKFRVMSSDVLVEQFKIIGANPQKMAFSEVYGALQSGMIDGQENTWVNMYSKRFFEVQKEISVSNHGVVESLVVTNLKFWNKLPKDIQTELRSILTEVTLKVDKWSSQKALEDRAKIERSGKTHINILSKAQLETWQNAMKPVWAKFAPEIGQDSIDAVLKCNKL